jgi:hypothetical protein
MLVKEAVRGARREENFQINFCCRFALWVHAWPTRYALSRSNSDNAHRVLFCETLSESCQTGTAKTNGAN